MKGLDIFLTGFIIGLALGLVSTVILVSVAESRRTKYCPECGTQYRDEVMYCSFDGTELKMRDKGE